MPEEHVGIFAMQKSACHDHLAVQQNMPGNQAQKVALVTVGAVEHRRNRKTAAVVQIHAGKCRKICQVSFGKVLLVTCRGFLFCNNGVKIANIRVVFSCRRFRLFKSFRITDSSSSSPLLKISLRWLLTMLTSTLFNLYICSL